MNFLGFGGGAAPFILGDVINPRSNASSPRNTTALYLYFSFVITLFFSMDIEKELSTLSQSCIYFKLLKILATKKRKGRKEGK